MILLYIYTEIYFNLTNKYRLLKLVALWLVGYFPHQWKSSYDQSPTIGQLHDDIILLQLPESLSLLFSCAN